MWKIDYDPRIAGEPIESWEEGDYDTWEPEVVFFREDGSILIITEDGCQITLKYFKGPND